MFFPSWTSEGRGRMEQSGIKRGRGRPPGSGKKQLAKAAQDAQINDALARLKAVTGEPPTTVPVATLVEPVELVNRVTDLVPNVHMPPSMNRAKMGTVALSKMTTAQALRFQVDRINQQADPVGFLIAVANGDPMLHREIDPETGVLRYVTVCPTFEDRYAAHCRLLERSSVKPSAKMAELENEGGDGDSAAWLVNVKKRAGQSDEQG